MKHLHLILAAAFGFIIAACSSDDPLIVETPQVTDTEATEVPILFSSMGNPITRADYTGKEAATLLGNKFVVFGYKGANTSTVGSTVFDNYQVEYQENTAHTTQSNVANWEYVGVTPIKHATNNGITSQKIKYWDYTQAQYDFIAWSTGTATPVYEGTPTDGQVLVSEITAAAATSPATGLAAAYTFTGKAADLSKCYIADLVTVKKAEYGENPVTLKFRQLGTKVRIGIYETVPGYSVKDVEFYSAAATGELSTGAKLFTTTANDIYTEGVYEVSFPVVDNTSAEGNNQARVKFTPKEGVTQKTTIDWGALNYTIAEEGEKTAGSVFLGRSSNTASFAGNADANYYVVYLPNESGTNLNLRVNYTLESTDGSGEVINVKGATAQVPSIYTAWKPGFAYTYLFKISDKTNGYTGAYNPLKPDDTTVNSDPAGLYPITFDAMVENAEEDGTQETITTVSTPSITTYQKGSAVVDNNEYLAATGPIFVTVNDGNNATTPDLANGKLVALTADNAALYTLSETDATEADVIDALQVRDDANGSYTIKGRSGLGLTSADNTLVNKIEYGVDGNTIDLKDGDKTKAMKFTATAGTYAFVYTKTAATGDPTAKFQATTVAVGVSVAGLYRYKLVAAAAGDVEKGVKYFSKGDATEDMLTVFLGQGVSNLYVDNAGTKEIASGYAKTGTTYYYTTDGGQTYTAAHNVAYGSPKDAGLYEKSGDTYSATTDTTPADGKAYYFKDGEKYIYCVFLPQQTTGLFVLDTAADKVACGSSAVAVNGMTYFDKYTQNNGVYYAKVIKVQ